MITPTPFPPPFSRNSTQVVRLTNELPPGNARVSAGRGSLGHDSQHQVSTAEVIPDGSRKMRGGGRIVPSVLGGGNPAENPEAGWVAAAIGAGDEANKVRSLC